MTKDAMDIRLMNWANVIKECNNSGVAKSVWIKEHGINEKTFYRYQKIIRNRLYNELMQGEERNEISAVALPLKPKEERTNEAETFIPKAILHVNRISIEISNEISQELLSSLVSVVSHA